MSFRKGRALAIYTAMPVDKRPGPMATLKIQFVINGIKDDAIQSVAGRIARWKNPERLPCELGEVFLRIGEETVAQPRTASA